MSGDENSETPTADAVESFLFGKATMKNGERDTNLSNEGTTTSKYERLHGNTDKDPFDSGNVYYTVLKRLGYPLDLVEGAVAPGTNQPLPQMVRVMVDSEETSIKIRTIDVLIFSYDITTFFYAASKGDPFILYKFLHRRTDEVFDKNPWIKIRKATEPRMKPVLERCFMLAYEKQKHKLHYTSYPEEDQLYKELEEKGVRPIDPEAMGLVMMPMIKEILDQHPELLPENQGTSQ